MLIRSKTKILNLAHAFEFEYNQASQVLTVWWAVPVPPGLTSANNGDAGHIASLYDTDRLAYFEVEFNDWMRFTQRWA